ncbi:phosphoribosyl 1,2-cyclic phosphate phosphodiesterase [Catalinimonas alkaloidigena]|uniref:MBL fold metallo-hydrolase n=1 Tax=Catalinimonas alkaloidigena TaxID=1075417 RepID=UPI00240674BB|nr:MBL fold metallo-hydrolase [Catalinimonas alkaloidigena]MDF9797698.1 phosphoribosyl 1,2-cyclic phosphate phosphodiesterase [Catalinimonas alkaloidigena]
MRVTFLGTGTSQGVPVINCQCKVCSSLDYRDKRLRSSVHIEVDDKSFIIDSGPDFRQQVLSNQITKLDALIFTHQHKDHIAGMDDVRGFNFTQQKDMPVYASSQVIRQLKQEFAYVFVNDKYPGVPRVVVNEIQNQPFIAEGVTFTPIEVLHYKLPVFGYRIGNFTYITDAKTIAEEEKEKLFGTEVLVLNALQHKQHISHFTLEESLALIEEINPRRAFLTHISHNLGMHQEVSRMLPLGVQLAYDSLSIEI